MSHGSGLARTLMLSRFTMTNRLETIATRQRSTRLRDAMFAAFVMLGIAISASTVATAATAANPVAAQR